jgi:hypothetical protein
MRGVFPPPEARVRSGARSPGAQAEPGRKVDAGSAWSGAARRARRRRGLEVKVPLVELFTRPMPQDVQLLALLRESTVA